MATKRGRFDAPAVAQSGTITITAYDAATTYTLTSNGKSVSTIAAGSAILTATALVTAWNNSTIPELTEITTASSGTAVITFTGDTAGKPVTVSSSVAGGAGTIGAYAAVTASSGPSHWDTAANWSPSGVPITGDDVFLDGNAEILYGLDQSAVTLASLNIPATFTGKLGLPDRNASGSYFEYREKYLKVSATILNVGQGEGQASGRIKINLGTNASTVNVEGMASPADAGLPALQLLGSHASNVLNATQGTIGLAVEAGTTAQFPVIRVGSENNPTSDVTLTCGAGCTLAGTINQAGGNVTVETNVTTWTKTTSSTSTALKAAAITTLTQDGQGTHYHQSNGTIGTANFRGENAVFDCARDLRTRTMTNGVFTGGAYVNDPNKTLTFTNPITTDQKSLARHVLSLAPFLLQRT